MPISQIVVYFENLYHCFLEELTPFPLASKLNLYNKSLLCFKTKNNSNFAVKVAEGSNLPFSIHLMNHFVEISALFNMWQWNM